MIKHNNLYGISFKVIDSFAIAALYAINKQLLQVLPSSQATFLYKLTVFIFLTPWVLRKGWQAIKTPALPLHVVRAFLTVSASLSFAYGLKYTDLVNAMALLHIEQVFWAIIGILYFKEKMTLIKLLAVFTSFSAMLLIVYPEVFETTNAVRTSITLNYHYVFIVIAAFLWSLNATVLKVIGNKTVKNEVQAFYGLLFQVIIAYPAAFFIWEWNNLANTFISYPTLSGFVDWTSFHLENKQVIQLLMLALMYFIHVLTFFLSMRYAEMSTMAPFDYTRLVFTCILAYFVIGDIPQHVTQYIGYAMIICSGVVLATTERRKQKKEQLEAQIENVY